MSLKEYIKDKIVNVILFVVFEIFVFLLLSIFRFGINMAVMICIIALVFFYSRIYVGVYKKESLL